MTEANPYSAPEHAPPVLDEKAEKARRTNLINRRTAAFLIDSLIYTLTIGFPMAMLVRRTFGEVHLFVSTLLVDIPLFVLRDLLGAASPGKRAVGLGLERDDGQGAPSVGARILRNLTCIVPMTPLVEYFVAYYGSTDMQRLGDKIAHTRVVDRAPERYAGTSWSWQMLAVLLLTWVGYAFGLRFLAPFWAHLFGVG